MHDLLGYKVELLQLAEHCVHGLVLAEDVHAADELDDGIGVGNQAADVVVWAGVGLEIGVRLRFD